MARTTTVSKVMGGDVTTTRKGGEITATRKGGDVTITRTGGGGVVTGETKIDAASLEMIRGLFAQAKEQYASGGAYTAGIEAQLTRGRKRAMAGGMQGLAAAGLATTSMAGGLARKYEEEVAAPTMAQAESARLAAMTGLMTAQAGTEAQLAPRFTTQTTTPTPETTRQVTTPQVTTQQIAPQITTQQMAPRTTTQQTTSPLLRAAPSAIPSWQLQSQKRVAGQQQPATQPTRATQLIGQPRPAQPTFKPFPSLFGTQQQESAAVSKPLGSFYGDFQAAAPKKTPSLTDVYSLADIYSFNL